MNIGISKGCYGRIPLEEQIRLMKENGFTATFVGNEYEDFDRDVTAFQQAGIAVETIHAPFDGINDLWLPGEAGDKMLARLINCLEDAKRHEIPLIVVHLSSGINPPIVSDVGNARLKKLMEASRETGVPIAFENQRKMANLALMFEYYPDAVFCWDTGHEACFTPGWEYMPFFGKKLAALHVHDNTAEFDKDYHMLPFDGKIDFDRVARQIAASPFRGTLMLEAHRGASDLYDDMTAEEYYRRAGAAARKLADMVEEYRK